MPIAVPELDPDLDDIENATLDAIEPLTAETPSDD